MGYRIFLTEGSSRLAESLINHFEDLPYTLVTPADCDAAWDNEEQLATLFSNRKPSFVINTQAISHLLGGSLGSVSVLARVCERFDVPLLHVSSYAVFSDLEDSAFLESEEAIAGDDVGIHLLNEERAAQQASSSIILRLSWLIDSEGDNLLTEICRRLVNNESLGVSDQSAGSPTHFDDVTRVVIAMLQQVLCGAQNWGVFHLCTADRCVEAEFADYLSRLLVAEGVDVGGYNVVSQSQRLMENCANITGSRCNEGFGIQLRTWRQGVKPLVLDWLGKS